MTQQHPITPPSELVQQWIEKTRSNDCIGAYPADLEQQICACAAQYGADQELEACCEWLHDPDLNVDTYKLRADRRPQPPSLKEQAIAALERYEAEEWCEEMTFDSSIIRRALAQLPDHE
jgi:crotonobetainyl-CoA:carnitine CoA-transferase CaiB-like acyl-CoA transferase